ncbi:MAG TPA: protease modulator HflK [Scandinavium sp.]|jgi:regulator of protease activity HflC (stomatin/prohibitin superfamily)|uniref:protease modulator HflK n=1 Tax=Scandinavium sp. TaxID=2830653 RepID=UPI002E367BFD|nr:protease modulator HflK [Scandinavium sp.]HEX4502531.1 protease modulator HflK [Scandinavium sp.]
MKKQPSVASPWGQSYRIAFFSLYGATLLAALAWVFSSFHQITPDTQAVVFRFGKPVNVESSGMLFAWPKPVDRVEIIPGPARILQHDVLPLQRSEQQKLLSADQRSSDAGAGAGYLLTGDSGVVQLNMQVFYRIHSPLRYVLQRSHIDPLLDRLAQHAATLVAAGRDLDTILVARPETLQNDSHAAQERSRLRSDLKQQIAHDLALLKGSDNDPGITIERVDVASSLPDNAVDAFNAVLTASQRAEQNIAQAQNEATLQLQKSQQQADRLIQQAQASSSEMHAKAEVATQTITKLAQVRATGSDAGMLQRIWREKISAVLSHAGQVITVNPDDDSKLILPGPTPQVEQPSSSSQWYGGIP